MTAKEIAPWSWEVIPNVQDRRRKVEQLLIEELAKLGAPSNALPDVHMIPAYWYSRPGDVNKLSIAVGFYPARKKIFREPKRGFNLTNVATVAASAWEILESRRREADENNAALRAWHEAKLRVVAAGLPEGVWVDSTRTGLDVMVRSVTEEQAQSLIYTLGKWRAEWTSTTTPAPTA